MSSYCVTDPNVRSGVPRASCSVLAQVRDGDSQASAPGSSGETGAMWSRPGFDWRTPSGVLLESLARAIPAQSNAVLLPAVLLPKAKEKPQRDDPRGPFRAWELPTRGRSEPATNRSAVFGRALRQLPRSRGSSGCSGGALGHRPPVSGPGCRLAGAASLIEDAPDLVGEGAQRQRRRRSSADDRQLRDAATHWTPPMDTALGTALEPCFEPAAGPRPLVAQSSDSAIEETGPAQPRRGLRG